MRACEARRFDLFESLNLTPVGSQPSFPKRTAQLMSWSKRVHFQMITIPQFVLNGGIAKAILSSTFDLNLDLCLCLWGQLLVVSAAEAMR
jgi:hypothetical protein